MENNRVKASTSSANAIATVEEIQKRLIRPPNSQRGDRISQSSSYLNASLRKVREIKLTREISSKKLEDYLDPVLLSAVRVKIGGKRKFDEEKNIKIGYLNEFDQFEQWPKEEKSPKFGKNEAVDLQNDSDWTGDSDGDEGIFCTPFLQFEKTALKRFKE